MIFDIKTILLIVWVIFVVFILISFYYLGKKALSIFPDINSVLIKYRDQSASGYSTKSILTKFGGANKVLDIVVTKVILDFQSNIGENKQVVLFTNSPDDFLKEIKR